MVGSMGICHGIHDEAVAIWRLLLMKHLGMECLLNQSPNAGIKWLDFCPYALAEFCRGQMDVQTSRVGALRPTCSRTRSMISSKAPMTSGQPGFRVDSDKKIRPRSSPS